MYSILDYNFDLPPELIADKPLETRSASRMLTVNRSAGTFDDDVFERLPEILRSDDLLVVNNTKVFPARLLGNTDSGAHVEIFLIGEEADGTWIALARPGKRLRSGKRVTFDERLSAEVVEKLDDGRIKIRFNASGDLMAEIDRLGRTPLPPYIKRDSNAIDTDRERYQTIYASNRGAIAAPTAGLHFTPEIIAALRGRGIEIAEVTLHVGYGTFEPVRTEDLSRHSVSPERFSISAEAAASINAARSAGRRLVAVGTTTTRTLEFMISKYGEFKHDAGYADLTITPGYRFKAVDALLTNFHLPQSSLLILVSAFAGRELIMRAYRHAVEEKYRFYSYGDCMLIT